MARGETTFGPNRDVIPTRVTKSFTLPGILPATAGNWGVMFWTADAAYELVSCSERHATAGNDAGAVTVMLTI